MAILQALWRARLFVLIGLLGLFFVGILYLRSELKMADKNLSDANVKISSYEKQIDDLKIKTDKIISELADETKRRQDAVAASRKREREIRNVSKDKDGPVAPVLSDSLDRLR